MKRVVKCLFIAALVLAGLGLARSEDNPLEEKAQIVTAYLFVQCGEPLRVLLVASDGSSRVFDMSALEAILPTIMALPQSGRLRVNLPKPTNGCPISV